MAENNETNVPLKPMPETPAQVPPVSPNETHSVLPDVQAQVNKDRAAAALAEIVKKATDGIADSTNGGGGNSSAGGGGHH